MQKLPKDEKYMRILATVAEAWVSQRQLKIMYQPLAAEKPTERVIEPYYIEPASFGHASYVIGYCHLKKAIRTFKVERIESANLTAETYTIPVDFDANKYMASSWGIVVKEEIKTVKLKIVDPEIIRIMTEIIWHPSQTLKKQKDGSTIMTLMINDTYEFYSWIMGWGEKIEVLSPPEIREKIIETIETMRDVYRNNSKQVLT
jgi:predicted DNA-binding transcriptional regulator YafY